MIACLTLSCRATPANSRYLITAAPIALGVGSTLCLAVEPANAKGVWWWHPGAAGCATRSSGPGLFEAQDVSLTLTGQTSGTIRFRIPVHRAIASPGPPYVDVSLRLENDQLTVAGTQTRVAVERRDTLDIPGNT